MYAQINAWKKGSLKIKLYAGLSSIILEFKIKLIWSVSYTGVLIKSLARPGRKQATATEDFDVHISYLLS